MRTKPIRIENLGTLNIKFIAGSVASIVSEGPLLNRVASHRITPTRREPDGDLLRRATCESSRLKHSVSAFAVVAAGSPPGRRRAAAGPSTTHAIGVQPDQSNPSHNCWVTPNWRGSSPPSDSF